MGDQAPKLRMVQADIRDGVAYFVVPDISRFQRVLVWVTGSEVAQFQVVYSVTKPNGEIVLHTSQLISVPLTAGVAHMIELRPPEIAHRYAYLDTVSVALSPAEGSAPFEMLNLVFEYMD
jgi:hypothetical protein